MSTLEKLRQLGDAAKYDLCASTSCYRSVSGSTRVGSPSPPGLCHSFLPDGRCVSLLKVLYTNRCIHDCKYCSNSTFCKKNGLKFDQKELADLFMNFYLRNYVEGLFLSSGVAGSAEKSNEDIISVVEYLRKVHKFQGYIHLKLLPGTSYDAIVHACELADRVSLNLEMPTKSHFEELSSTKDYKIDLLRRLIWLRDIKRKIKLHSGYTTQFVVGAAEETDLEFIKMTNWLYNKLDLKRAYFSGFVPIKKTPLEMLPKENILREHRLYQTDWLMRVYNFSFDEVKTTLNEDDNFDLQSDPKITLAQQNLDMYPLDINSASHDELIHIPGVGIQSAKKIIYLRKNKTKITKLRELKNIGVVLKRAIPYLTINGSKQTTLLNFGA